MKKTAYNLGINNLYKSIMDPQIQKQLNLSPAMLEKLAKLHLYSVDDIVMHQPLRYEDETKLTTLNQANIGSTILIDVIVLLQKVKYRPHKQLLLQVADNNQNLFFIRLINFFPNQIKLYSEQTKLRVFGELRAGYYGLEMVHPKIKTQFSEQLNPYLTPIYSTVYGISQNSMQTIVQNAIKIADLHDTLPDNLIKKYNLINFHDAIYHLHQVKPQQTFAATTLDVLPEDLMLALKRLKFDELLAQQLSMKLIKAKRLVHKKKPFTFSKQLAEKLIQSLPFELTSGQQKVIIEIEEDLLRPYPMHRLLQGDVGSGKTIVSALIALMVIESGHQVALIAPTEILAEQHYHKFSQWFQNLNIQVGYLIGNQTKKIKELEKSKIKQGDYPIVIGTHALIQKDVEFKNLGLIIIDEQHRFGVNQRLELKQKGSEAHQLMMSATPIPRTLSMTYFADVDISIIDTLPPNRSLVNTILVTERRRDEIVQFAHQKILQGRQIYWVCPLIEESEVLQLQTAIDTYESLQKILPDISIGLVHGKLKSAEKSQIMQDFKENKIQLLVSTTVIEVGVDVPNAATMIIEHSERMGLSQLHQLRGRVGRGENITSECILIYHEPLSELEKKRLKIIFTEHNGFEIAKQDLLIRGPGEFLGAKQSGIPLFRFADLTEDGAMIEEISKVADQLLISAPEVVEQHLARWLTNKEAYLGV